MKSVSLSAFRILTSPFPSFCSVGARIASGGFTNGGSTQQIWLDQVNCVGTEARLADCPARSFGDTQSCVHVNDVGVGCVSCTNGTVRLQDGASIYEGRVEVCNDNAWGTICEDRWGDADAQVVCRQLNFPAAGEIGN